MSASNKKYHQELNELLLKSATDGDLTKVQQLIGLCGTLDKFFAPKTYRRMAIVRLLAEAVKHGHAPIVKYIISLADFFVGNCLFDMLNIAAVFNRAEAANLILKQIRRRNLASKIKITYVAFNLALLNESISVADLIYEKVGGYAPMFARGNILPYYAWSKLLERYSASNKLLFNSVKFLMRIFDREQNPI
jgi:hypothetical protein